MATMNALRRLASRQLEPRLPRRVLFFAGAAAVALCGCATAPMHRAEAQQIEAAVAELPLEDAAAVLVGAGDIARCARLEPALATAELVEALLAAAPEALVFTTGDHAYEEGTMLELETCYGPTWGRFNERTLPAPGNHDYRTDGGSPYYDYFAFYRRNPDARARGYYSFAVQGWHIVSLNSNRPMDEDSDQVRWLEADLAQSAGQCILAYWHHPLFSSGFHGLYWRDRGRATVTFWRVLEQFDADLVVNGHAHMYERFVPQTAAGNASSDGIRQIVAGTGGADRDWLVRRRANSEYANNDVHGVLVLMLSEGSYEWAFVGTDGVVHDRSDGPVAC